jgi:membrane-anchored protein YejM (alkaline phosphatase superfamily)
VVVGDHGQAFGEHGVWQHGRSSWEEVLHVPALIWQPAALSPRVESRLTTHADLLPTILDMLGVAFDPLDFQGESLCAPELRRRYAFATGREGVVISWDVATRSKLSWSHLTGQCRRFELASDPNERDELPCETTSEQYQTMKRFYLSQRKTLLDYAGSRRLAD